jgi:uncharacterized protein (DUF58 family)
MNELLPKPVSASATSAGRHGRWSGFVLTPRSLWLLVAGFAFAVPAFFRPHLLWMMLAWDALILLLAVVDAVQLPPAHSIAVQRRLLQIPALGRRTEVEIEIRQSVAPHLRIRVMDSLHPTWSLTPVFHPVVAWRNHPATVSLRCWPRTRGPVELGTAYVRYSSALGLVERRAQADLAQTVLVVPSPLTSADDSVFLLRARQAELQRRRIRRIGLGREFERLREYQPGDEPRFISWTATARRGKLITRTFTAERSQQVWIVVDAGRLSNTTFRLRIADAPSYTETLGYGDLQFGDFGVLDITQLDQSASASLLLAQVIERAGDRSALLAYGRAIQQQILPGKGALHLRRMVEALSMVRAEVTEADHRRAAARLRQLQTRRGMVFWICDVAESVALPEVAQAITELARHHQCVLILIEHPELRTFAGSEPQDVPHMFAVTAANEILERRRGLLQQIRRRGVMVVETSPAEVGVAAINQYLEIKERGML